MLIYNLARSGDKIIAKKPKYRVSVFLFSMLICGGLVQAQLYDYILQGGHVIDPKNGRDGAFDVAIQEGKIAAIEETIDSVLAREVINVEDLYVTPGLVDMHVHVFNGHTPGSYIADGPTSVPPDGFTFRSGVTTVVDAGSSGWKNFRQFKEQTIDQSKTRVLAFLNIVGVGMLGRFEEQNVADMNPIMTAHMIDKLYPDILVGIKSAHYWGDFTQVDLAVEAGELAGVPVMVDFGEHDPPNSIESLFHKHLRPGDIFTHTYAYVPRHREPVVDEEGQVKDFVLTAQERGIVFDVGHGGGSFSWRQALPAIEQGFLADVISTDLHTQSMNDAMKDLCNVMSKFMAMGVSLQEVVERVTWKPAQVIRRHDLGNLDIGAPADVAVLRLRTGNFGFIDVRDKKFLGQQKLETELTIRAGEIVWDLNGISKKPFTHD